MNVNDYIIHETERQSGTMREALGMRDAYDHLMLDVEDGTAMPGEPTLLLLARLLNDSPGYRKTPAVFNQGQPALPANVIPQAMTVLCGFMEQESDPARYADEYTYEFLCIHPFADGNGRVGSLLWNRLRGTLRDPEPMPYFFGEN